MLATLYLVSAGAILGVTVWTIIQVRKRGLSGYLIGLLAAIPFSVLSMIKLRCLTGPFNCGFMSFLDGFTWHLFAGLIGFVILWVVGSAAFNRFRPFGWSIWMEKFGRLISPLLGLWVSVLWETLPVPVIHPPSHGGPCPSIPIICHDTPFLGRGGLLYWAAPFILWTAVSLWQEFKLILNDELRVKSRVRF